MACLRPLLLLCLAAMLAACASSPSSTLGELPRTPQATTQQLLEKASQSDPEQAAQLRLAAADQSMQQGNTAQAQNILRQVPLDGLMPAQQIFALTLQGEIALANGEPEKAEQAFQHPAFERLGELPVAQQIRSQLARAAALEATNKPLAAARERVFTAPLLSGEQAKTNHEAIWKLISALPEKQLQGATDTDLAGWQALALSLKRAGTVTQQQRAMEDWIAQNPQHPAALQLPESLQKLRELADQPLTDRKSVV